MQGFSRKLYSFCVESRIVSPEGHSSPGSAPSRFARYLFDSVVGCFRHISPPLLVFQVNGNIRRRDMGRLWERV